MPRILREQISFQAVAPGQIATADLPVGDVAYHHLRIGYGTGTAGGPTRANMEAEIERIRLLLNGVVQREFTAAELFALNAYHGVAVQDGVLPIFLSEPWRRSVQGEDSLAWGTADVRTFQVEVEIAAGATNPTLKGLNLFERVRRNLQAIVKWNRFTVPITAVGVTNWLPPREDAYYAIHAFSANITDVEVTVDGEKVIKATDGELDALQTDLGNVPQTGLLAIDFAPTNRVSDALPMITGQGRNARRVAQFQLDFNMGAATTFPVVTETLGPRN